MLIRRWVLGVAAAALMSAPALAQTAGPAVIYDVGGKFDRSFNEAAFNGAERFKRETNVDYREFEIQNDAQREQALRQFAQRGHSPIVAVGFNFRTALERVAPEFPNLRFTLIDSVVNAPNVQSILFSEHEGSYLVGVAAGMATRSNTVGFIGGMDIPLIRAFGCGFVQGVKSVRPTINVVQNMTGTAPTAFRDPVRGAELARGQITQGADVIYAAAGATGIGVLQTVADAQRLGIGVDSNQNGLHPGRVLTSMLKRVDNAVYQSFSAARAGTWAAGTTRLGLAQGGVDWAVDDNNRPLLTAELTAAVNAARDGIIAGRISVHDYRANNACPVQ
jgi:basic membrane protein A